MRKITSWLAGLAIGGGLSAVLVALFVPQSSKDVRQHLRDSYEAAMAEARRASTERRAELEAELEAMRSGQNNES